MDPAAAPPAPGPRRPGRGLGHRDLARRPATRARVAHGVDSGPEIAARAREPTPAAAPDVFTRGDAPRVPPAGLRDVLTRVAALHHLPLAGALTAFRGALAPGGTPVVFGPYRAAPPGDHLLGAAAIPPKAAIGLLRDRGRRPPRPASVTARTRPAASGFPDVAHTARATLPGARPRRRLSWRCTPAWRAPG
ncbi:SAM-dependent methyltransferase [Streptomyces tropicalis]|uniref:SAM-dependent methyltransferase n=1 Tax=Streptomyces tropicalis TaxID=3034234 RepID=UPI003F68B534